MSEPIQVVDLRGRPVARSSRSKKNSLKKPRRPPPESGRDSDDDPETPTQDSPTSAFSSATRRSRTSSATSRTYIAPVPASILQAASGNTRSFSRTPSVRSTNGNVYNAGGGTYITTNGGGGGTYVNNTSGRAVPVNIRTEGPSGTNVRSSNGVPVYVSTNSGKTSTSGNVPPISGVPRTSTRTRRASDASATSTIQPTRGRSTTTSRTPQYQPVPPPTTIINTSAPTAFREASRQPARSSSVSRRDTSRDTSRTRPPTTNRTTSNSRHASPHQPATTTTVTHNVATTSTSRPQPQQQRGANPKKEQVLYIPSDQPIIILDERRNKNTPLPTIIRDGKVIMAGGAGNGGTQIKSYNATVVRSDRGGERSLLTFPFVLQLISRLQPEFALSIRRCVMPVPPNHSNVIVARDSNTGMKSPAAPLSPIP